MKTLAHISPSGLKTWQANPEEFYLIYLANDRPMKMPQTQPMCVGSAFDAYAKSYLHERLIGKAPEYEFQTLFDKQVEPQNRDFALKAGKRCFDVYCELGAMADLMLELSTAVSQPRFEFEIKGMVTTAFGEVTLMGKPDIFFINDQGARVVYDWKVNGYLSKASPTKGFIKLRPGGHWHKDALPFKDRGITVNAAMTLDETNPEWGQQIATYAWLLGEPVGSTNWIAGIDQLACNSEKGEIRVASHRSKVDSSFQNQLFQNYVTLWHLAKSEHFFSHMSPAESTERCLLLDKQAEALRGDGSDADKWFEKVIRSHD